VEVTNVSMNNEPTLIQKLFLPVYALLKPVISFKIGFAFLKHPITALKNIRYFVKKGYESPEIFCFGVESREGFLKTLREMKENYLKGRSKTKPQVWIFQAYCEKPHKCSCSPSRESPYTISPAQKRFNEFCVFSGKSSISKACNNTCRIGSQITQFQTEGRYIDIYFKIMLNEKQMVDFWDEMLSYQAKTGTVIPFVMDVCPFALWLARKNLFHLKTPLGIVFLFQTENRCKTFIQYINADRGLKDAKDPVGLTKGIYTEKLCFLNEIKKIAQ